MKILAVALGAALVVFATSCGVASSGPLAQASATGSENGPVLDAPPVDPSIWEDPLGKNAMSVASVADANLSYTADEPLVTEGLKTVVATNEGVPSEERQIAWVYDSEVVQSQFIIVEGLADASAAQDELEATGKAEPACTPVTPEDSSEGIGEGVRCIPEGLSLVSVRGGTLALLIEGPEVTSVTWVQPTETSGTVNIDDPGLQVMIAGPAKTLAADEALSLAEEV